MMLYMGTLIDALIVMGVVIIPLAIFIVIIIAVGSE